VKTRALAASSPVTMPEFSASWHERVGLFPGELQ
jgi:hypothetical protein